VPGSQLEVVGLMLPVWLITVAPRSLINSNR
jgi:hypothetical protein